MSADLTFRQFVQPLRWIDGRALASVIEPYRWRIFDRAFQRRDDLLLAFVYTLVLTGRAKKNWKTADLIFGELYALMADSPGGNQVLHVANDEGQADDGLELAKKLIRVNPLLQDWVTVKKNVIERRDGEGFLMILPGRDVVGSHGKTFRLLGVDEIHGQRDWDLLEALAPDPTRPDTQTWITSYASLFHRPGVPLFDLLQRAKSGADPRMLFDWWAADYCTAPEAEGLSPEDRANPSRPSWENPEYLAQQQRRLPAHKFRRLHLNLPGTPEGSAFQPEPVMDAVERGVGVRRPECTIRYSAFVDMSGGSSDDAVLAVGHRDDRDRLVLDRLVDQGARAPFDPRLAVERFVAVLREYGCTWVEGDKYAGETFRADFERHGIGYRVCEQSKSEIYEATEPLLNGHRVALLDVPQLEQQMLGLAWRGGKIDHQPGEHDDYANAVAGVVVSLAAAHRCSKCDDADCDGVTPPMCLIGSGTYGAWMRRHGVLNREDGPELIPDAERAALWEVVAPVIRALEQGDDRALAQANGALDGFLASLHPAAAHRARDLMQRVETAIEEGLDDVA